MLSTAIVKQTVRFPELTKNVMHGASSPEQDGELVARLVSGDESAVADLYATYGQRLYAYALRLTGDPEAAEDVTQETLVIAWRTAREFRGSGRLVAWLLGITHHQAMKSLRHAPRAVESLLENLAAPDASPEEQAQTQEMRRRVRQGLQELSVEHRAVLDLVFYQGLSLNEVAQVCGCPLGTVKSRLSYARKHLRGVLSSSQEDWR